MENDFPNKKMSPVTAIGFLLAGAFLITRAPVLWLIKSVLGLGFILIRPALIAFGMAKAWGLVDKAITKKAALNKPVTEPASEFQQAPVQVP